MNEIRALRRQVRNETKAYKLGAVESLSRLDMEKEIRQEKRAAIRAHAEAEKELKLQVLNESRDYKAVSNY